MTNQERMRRLLDERAQQARKPDEQATNPYTAQAYLQRWRGPRQSGSMRGRRSGR